ncbi:MAG: phospholipid carrier-dependent glycosyltransferase [Deltaproteobacteria bacterium]|nr:MAG: phospholipid carrier-dependent glycosyltransferase [Deltaproteobacteria bacterium]
MRARDGRYRAIALFVLLLGVGLRVSLAMVNTESNDDHFPVIRILHAERRIPVKSDCWECFQPKLYHVAVAGLQTAFGADSAAAPVRLAQLINALAGAATLAVVYLFLRGLGVANEVALAGFALVALNPKLIAINAQATNDSFAILFATLGLFFALHFFQKPGLRNFGWMTLSVILAALSKGNGLIVFCVLVAVFVLKLAGSLGARDAAAAWGRWLGAFCLVFLLFVPYLGQYWQNYRAYGSPFVINVRREPLPHLFEKTYAPWRGVTSIADSYLTFRFVELMRKPWIDYHPDVVSPRHRSSLWTQLYGRAHSAHFDGWPPSWRDPRTSTRNLARAAFLLALVPTAFFLFGLARIASAGWVRGRAGLRASLEGPQGIMALTGLAHLAFSVLYSLQYRSFTTMKAIFLFPGLLAFVFLLAEGMQTVYGRGASGGWARRMVGAALAALLVVYGLDVLILIATLAGGRPA